MVEAERMAFWQTGYGGYGRQESFFASPTFILIAACVLIYALLLIFGDPLLALLAQQGSAVLQNQAYWQLFTSMFVHFDLEHIVFNMLGLLYFGRLNEQHFSKLQFLAIYFGSGLLGNVMSLFLLPPDVLSGGASGAIFGLVGSYVAIARRAQHMGVALIYAVSIFIYSSGAGVNIFAHLFGLVGGIVLGLIFTAERKPEGSSVSYSFPAQPLISASAS